jgi:ketosteroid isomerase-like protein
MIWVSGMRAALLAFAIFVGLQAVPAHAQIVDNPNNLIKAWQEAYASRRADAMRRVYSRDAQLVGAFAKEPLVGIDAIRQHYERTAQPLAERSVVLSKLQFSPRKRITVVTGLMEMRSRGKDGAVRNTPGRFTMTIIRESRRQWSILSHHMSAAAQ